MTDTILRRGIGLLGGTFDPVHRGHLLLAKAALEAIPLVRIDFLPAGAPWQKGLISPAEHRLTMLQLAVEYDPCFRVNPMELLRSGPTYTIDTVRTLRESVGPGMPLVLILGMDQWTNLSTWRDWQQLTNYVHIAYCTRAGSPEFSLPAEQTDWSRDKTADAKTLTESPCGHIARFSMPGHNASATVIRRTLSQHPFGKAMTRLEDWLPASVVQYIRMHHLYSGARR